MNNKRKKKFHFSDYVPDSLGLLHNNETIAVLLSYDFFIVILVDTNYDGFHSCLVDENLRPWELKVLSTIITKPESPGAKTCVCCPVLYLNSQ
jgi:hypothetical protein